MDALVQRYKDSGQRAYARPLIHGLSKTVEKTFYRPPERRPELLIPAPMHPARRRKRGFNQAADIAEHLSRELGIPWSADSLKRTRYTPTQRGLNRQARLANLQGVFAVTKLLPDRVALVDDVITTGATTRQLAAVMKEVGVKEIEIWALARTPG
ncbi:phosphoribosyltransferase family protein [Marinobacter sp. CHS3-4]|uniref:ComF family protein n=1 Tax=Marinobacter sp. CHS3-4 TaxID=3045174 RepID=UPI0024B5BC60|nr:phosphoribosyltransferase family protein [Marinobacter sp. CHS3-4]MDI9244885.1 phosphoribosyltransferase family protein [Marinobacter sp. CHS3-4]